MLTKLYECVAHLFGTTNQQLILLCEPVLEEHVGTKSAQAHIKEKAHGLCDRFAEQNELLVALLVYALHLCRHMFVLKTFSSALFIAVSCIS